MQKKLNFILSFKSDGAKKTKYATLSIIDEQVYWRGPLHILRPSYSLVTCTWSQHCLQVLPR